MGAYDSSRLTEIFPSSKDVFTYLDRKGHERAQDLQERRPETRKLETATSSSSEFSPNQQQRSDTAMAGPTKPKLGFLEALAHGVKVGGSAAKQAAKVAYEQGRERQRSSMNEENVQPPHSTSTLPQTTFSEGVPQHLHVHEFSHPPQLSPGFPSVLHASDEARTHPPPIPIHASAIGPSPLYSKTALSDNSPHDSYRHSIKNDFRDAITIDAQREYVSKSYPQ